MNARMLLLGVTVASGILLAAVLGVAHATPPAGQVTEMLARGTATDELVLRVQGRFPNAKAGPWRGTYRTPWDVTTLRITLPPGGHTGWHRHPGPGFMTVVSGSVTVYANDCSRSTYTRGQSYVEVPGLVNLVRNDGAEPAVFVGTFVVPSTAPLRQDVATAPCTP